ncbi:MAG: guanylate kinase [Aphanocapsa feldmannii 277cV]|uniref:Guanylate kinase n=2 Tax=Aphanocapsa feldmannii TaxID=192050 RepID=A0A524RQT6_9CHRO|nr:MAG: guanylate kinase [Aphanocapsa feldmannii 277cV]TGH22147.1 MAG: guanylate kinase [Aphanocapsa feldmannii 277cI]
MAVMSSISPSTNLVVLTGPSGVGKGTLVHGLLERHPRIWLSVSATTRPPRQGEEEGRSYFFYGRARFEAEVVAGGFLEWAEFGGNLYGTPRGPLQQRLAEGRPVLLEIELEGARQVRRSFPGAVQIFLRPPSMAVLEQRIRGRGSDSEVAIRQRLQRGVEELRAEAEFDLSIVNDNLEQAVAELEAVMAPMLV